MAVDKITPNDSRIKSCHTEVGEHRWHYLDAIPQVPQRGTIVLVHGYPDISLAWRYQIPMLLGLGLRCIAIDCMGYGETGTSTNLSDFTFKRHADAIAGIAKHIGASHIILGGHDWGGLVVYRTAAWYPDLVTHVFSVATPYAQPTSQYLSAETLANGPMPNFGYQLQFGSKDHVVEKAVVGEDGMRTFLKGMYGGRPASEGHFMTPEKGVRLEALQGEIAMTQLLDQAELDYYVRAFTKNGLKGPCNWYRTRRLNYDEELQMPKIDRAGLRQPTLFIQALRDNILIPKMSEGMEKHIPKLTRGEVDASHWALWHTPQETNDIIKRWIEGVVFGGKSKL